MAGTRRKLIAGNWKMHGLRAAARREIAELAVKLRQDEALGCDVAIFPPATLLTELAAEAAGTAIDFGAQDCHPEAAGAHTGDIAAEMVRDSGGSYVIVGHSERRHDHGEGDALVRAKAEAAHRAGLIAVICIGETEIERDAGRTLAVVGGQLAASLPDRSDGRNTVVAYEPVWAIGTGRTPTFDQVAEVHAFIRETLSARFGADGGDIRVLYGGSVKPENAAALLSITNVDGALVGGASLKAGDFFAIIESCP